MNDGITLDSMVAELNGGESPAQETDPTPAAGAQQQNTDPASANPSAGEDTPPADDAAAQQQQQPPDDLVSQQAKAQQAFVHMRQQNKRQSELLRGVANVLGIENLDPNNEQQLLDALQTRITANQAEQQKVPVELLERLNTLEQQNRQYTAEQRQRDVAIGFQQVMDTFKLNQDDLNKFAQDIVTAGINPMEQSVDLVREYKIMHYDDLVAQAAASAVAVEQARAAKAQAQSTTPSNKAGAQTGGDVKVNSVRELTNWFENQH